MKKKTRGVVHHRTLVEHLGSLGARKVKIAPRKPGKTGVGVKPALTTNAGAQKGLSS